METEKQTLLLVPVDDSVVFPNMTVTLVVDVGDEERVLLVPREGDEFASVGTVAKVSEHVRLPGGGHAVALEGLHRGVAGAAHPHPAGNQRVEGGSHPHTPARGAGVPSMDRALRLIDPEVSLIDGDVRYQATLPGAWRDDLGPP